MSRAFEQLRQGDPLLLRLAESVSLAVRAEPALVRRARLRLVPEADPGVEADLWFHPVVRHPSAEGILLEPHAGDLLRAGLAERDPDRYELTWEITRDCHRSLSPALRLEEEVHYLVHSRSPDARDRIRRLLASALAALVAGDRRGLAGWAARALPRFPEEVRALEEAAMLGAAADLRLDRRIAEPNETPRVDERWLPWIAPASQAKIGVRLIEGALEVESPVPEDETYHRLAVLATEPRVLEILQDEEETMRLEIRREDSLAVKVGKGTIRLRTLLGEEYRLEPEATAVSREVLDFSGVFARHQPAYDPNFEKRLEKLFGNDGAQSRGLVRVAGPAGAGKTALLAHVARAFPPSGSELAPHHFARREVPDWAAPWRAERSLVAQVERLIPARRGNGGPGASLTSTLRRWSRARSGERLVVVIDAVDAIEGAWSSGFLRELASTEVPAGVTVVFSTRAESEEPSPDSRRITDLRAPEPSRAPPSWWFSEIRNAAVRTLGFEEEPYTKEETSFEDLLRAVLRSAGEELQTAWGLAAVAREALGQRQMERLAPVAADHPGIEVLLEFHPGPAGGFWIPRSDVIARSLSSVVGDEQERRYHQTLLGSVAAWPPAPEEAEELEPEEYAARRRFGLLHALHHALGARNLPRAEELIADLDYSVQRLRLEAPDRLIEELETAVEVAGKEFDESRARLLIGVLRRERARIAAQPEALVSLVHNQLVETESTPEDAFLFPGGRPPALRLHRLHRLSTGDGGDEVVRGHRGPVRGASWLGLSETQLLSWGEDGSVLLWPLPEGSPRRLAKRPGIPVVGCAVLPPSSITRIAVAFADGTVEIAAPDEDGSRAFQAHEAPLHGIGTPDFADTAFYTFAADGRIRIWQAEEATLLRSLHCHDGPVTAAVTFPENRLATGGGDGSVRIWDLGSGEELHRLEGHTAPVTTLVLGDSYLASAGEDSTIRLWDRGTLQAAAVLRGHDLAVTALAFDPGGRLVSASLDRTARRWDVETGAESDRFDHPAAVTDITLLDGGQTLRSAGESAWPLVTSCADGVLRGFDMRSEAWRRNPVLDAHALPCRGCATDSSGTGRFLASWSDDGTIAVWDLENAELDRRLGEPEPWRRPLVHGTRRWIGFGPRGVFKAHVDDEEIHWMGKPEGDASSMHVAVEGTDPDDTRVVYWGEDGAAELFELTDKSPRASKGGRSLKVSTRLERLGSFDLDASKPSVSAAALQGRRLIRAQGTDLLLHERDEPPQSVGTGHTRRIAGCAAALDERVLTWSWDATLRLFPVEGTQGARVLSGHRGPILACVTDRGGSRALSASADGSIRLWDLKKEIVLRVWEEVAPHVTALFLDEELCLAGTAAGEVIAMKSQWPEPVRTSGHQGVVRAFAVRAAPDSETGSVLFYSIGEDATLRLWKLLDSRGIETVATSFAEAPLRSVSAIDGFVAAQDSWGSLWIYRHEPDVGGEEGNT